MTKSAWSEGETMHDKAVAGKCSEVAEMYGVNQTTVRVCSQAPHPDDNVARLIDVYIIPPSLPPSPSPPQRLPPSISVPP